MGRTGAARGGLHLRAGPEVRGQSSAHRLAARRTLAKPIVDALQIWLETHLPHRTGRGKLAEAMRYALARWNGLTRFLYDGRIENATNPVERAIRPVAIGRKMFFAEQIKGIATFARSITKDAGAVVDLGLEIHPATRSAGRA
jgi:hypothetical protein